MVVTGNCMLKAQLYITPNWSAQSPTKEKSGLPQLVKNLYRIALVASILLQ